MVVMMEVMMELPDDIGATLDSPEFQMTCHEQFDGLDEDRSGSLTVDELYPVIAELAGTQGRGRILGYREHVFSSQGLPMLRITSKKERTSIEKVVGPDARDDLRIPPSASTSPLIAPWAIWR